MCGHADLRSQHVEVRLRHVEVRLRHVEVRLRHVEARHVKWSCIGGAARRKCQCANYREVGSKMPRHGFSPSPFSPPPASMCFKNKNYRMPMDPYWWPSL